MPGSDTPEAVPPAPIPESSDPHAESPGEEVGVSWRGAAWVARVVGRSGRAEARSAPLLLLGFWPNGPAAGAPALEAMVAGRRLEDVPEEALQAALDRAKAPPVAGQRRPFFEDSDPTRRSGPTSEY